MGALLFVAALYRHPVAQNQNAIAWAVHKIRAAFCFTGEYQGINTEQIRLKLRSFFDSSDNLETMAERAGALEMDRDPPVSPRHWFDL